MGLLWKIQNMLAGLPAEILTIDFSITRIKNATHSTMKFMHTRAEQQLKL